MCGDYDADVDISKYWHVKAPNSSNRIHMVFRVIGSKNGLLELFEDPTLSNDGIELTPFNNNRNSSNTTTVLVFKDPTVSSDGTLLVPEVIGTDTVNPTGRQGGVFNRHNEFLLRQGGSYLIKYTALTDNSRVSTLIAFYVVE